MMQADEDWRSFELTRQDLTKAHLRYFKMFMSRPRAWLWIPVIVCIAMAWGLLQGRWWEGLIWAGVILGCVPVVWRFVSLPLAARRRMRSQPWMQKPLAYAVRPDAFHYRTYMSESRVDWSGIRSHWFGKDIVLLFPTKDTFFIIPPAVVTAEERALMLAYLRPQA